MKPDCPCNFFFFVLSYSAFVLVSLVGRSARGSICLPVNVIFFVRKKFTGDLGGFNF